MTQALQIGRDVCIGAALASIASYFYAGPLAAVGTCLGALVFLASMALLAWGVNLATKAAEHGDSRSYLGILVLMKPPLTIVAFLVLAGKFGIGPVSLGLVVCVAAICIRGLLLSTEAEDTGYGARPKPGKLES